MAPLTADPQGRITSTATFPMPPDPSAYHVIVAPVGSDAVICGEFKRNT